mmetsp:Transcript_48492/g.58710  ORF Transcript_48492/g.58710 Transcript_48492/m.58710 type:complete len:349 (+) Transcript_48492:206-1252(+)|eukprot:CAMPEP_0172496350 /NCGR_PEP_ID=MMETSP1066-20121228/85816_1 /TAXON_ID=671091 /ORGANISM="Coscinodiscus wailesii, Strain CCMP2513" /LENGTH=348 /DNA_ID=CAMNT_0013268611 /DNA_START=193 /DNA_END=1239 /DNA_ORIENTATION=+
MTMTKSPSFTKKHKKFDPIVIPEINVAGKKKDHPSISDYYKAASSGAKPIQYQHGLSNYSHVQLGDDRISFKKSLSQDVFRLDTERADKMAAFSSAVTPTQKSHCHKQRKVMYAEANDAVGLDKIHEMEQMMRDKLQQRTKTGPFQLRKTFKYFDRDGSGGIDFPEFQRAMELMGFQFTEMQQLALFARYDESACGEVNYNDFVEKVMEADFQRVCQSPHRKSIEKMISSFFPMDHCLGAHDVRKDSSGTYLSSYRNYDDDGLSDDEEEIEAFKREEMKKIFTKIDVDGNQSIDKVELEKLLMEFGLTGSSISREVIDQGFDRLDKDKSGRIEFDEFYEWYKSIEESN